MNTLVLRRAAAFAAALGTVAAAAAGAYAQSSTGTTKTSPPQKPPHHNSNTLTKIGKAIQYTARKDTSNATVGIHKAEGKHSVVRNRQTGNNYVVKKNGKTKLKSTTNPREKRLHRAYRRHGHATGTTYKKNSA